MSGSSTKPSLFLAEHQHDTSGRFVLHQPYFLPWLGYFAKICWADAIVFFDNADFRKRHYHDRARIVDMHGQVNYINVPVGQNLGSKLNEIGIPSEEKFPSALINTIKVSYAKAPFFREEFPELEQDLVEYSQSNNLADANEKLIRSIWGRIETRKEKMWYRSSSFDKKDDATTAIVTASRVTNCPVLLVGSISTFTKGVHNADVIRKSGLKISLQDFLSVQFEYPQSRRTRAGFAPNLSVVDALFNIGRERLLDVLSRPDLNPIGVEDVFRK